MSTPDETSLLITLARAVHSLASGDHATDIEAALAKFGVKPEKPKEEPVEKPDEPEPAPEHDVPVPPAQAFVTAPAPAFEARPIEDHKEAT